MVVIAVTTGIVIATGSINFGTKPKGLIGYWSLAQDSLIASDTFADLTPYSNDGDSQAPPTFTSDRFNHPDRTMYFSGHDDVVEVSHNDSLSLITDISISAWIKQTELTFGGAILLKRV